MTRTIIRFTADVQVYRVSLLCRNPLSTNMVVGTAEVTYAILKQRQRLNRHRSLIMLVQRSADNKAFDVF
jgi:hypothetical protein